MSQAEEKFMEDRRKMEYLIAEFFESCQAIGIDNEGFMEDVNEAVSDATSGKLKFEEWVE